MNTSPYSRLSVSNFQPNRVARVASYASTKSCLVHVHKKLLVVILHAQVLFSVSFDVLTTESCGKWPKGFIPNALLRSIVCYLIYPIGSFDHLDFTCLPFESHSVFANT